MVSGQDNTVSGCTNLDHILPDESNAELENEDVSKVIVEVVFNKAAFGFGSC
jgi:hypothetical protein